jgi:hypothetical protein
VAYKQANAALANLQEMTRRINAGEGSLGQPAARRAAGEVADLGNRTILDQVTGRLSRGEGTAGKLLTDSSSTIGSIRLRSRIDKLTTDLEQGQGSAGPVAPRQAVI